MPLIKSQTRGIRQDGLDPLPPNFDSLPTNRLRIHRVPAIGGSIAAPVSWHLISSLLAIVVAATDIIIHSLSSVSAHFLLNIELAA